MKIKGLTKVEKKIYYPKSNNNYSIFSYLYVTFETIIMMIEDIALTLVHGLGTKGIIHLVSVFGSSEAIFGATEQELISRAALSPTLARKIVKKESFGQAEKEIKHLEKHNIKAISSLSDDYPRLLLEIPDYPHVIYVQGSVDILHNRFLSMVGTREMSPYGERVCNRLVEQLSEIAPNTTIVSGLAFGIDVSCHRAALHYGLPTVAVLANSLPEVTPTQHRKIADEILNKGGALVTELHSQFKNKGNMFLLRNRIIAALSEGTIVVESPYEGGSLRTAEMAFEYNRTLMAVPARVDDKRSYGANMLIKQRKASMVCSGNDVAHELGWDITKRGFVPKHSAEMPLLSVEEKAVFDCFKEGEAVDLDSLLVRSQLDVSTLLAVLLGLELGGLVRVLPGKIYEKT